MKEIPLTLPRSPPKRQQISLEKNVPLISNISFGTFDRTPAAPRELYKTCLADELRQTPEYSTPTNDKVNRSIQAFHTPFPVKPSAEVVRVISALDSNSDGSDSSPNVTNPSAPLGAFKVATPAKNAVAPLQPKPSRNGLQLNVSFAPEVECPPILSQSDATVSIPSPKRKMSARKSNNMSLADKEVPEQSVAEMPVVNVPDEFEETSQQLPLVDVEYSSWSLLPTRKFSGIFVNGRNVSSGLGANSSRIVERLDSSTLKSSSGSVIRLIGPMDQKTMFHFYISRSLIGAFSNGFPEDWLARVDSEMRRLKGATEGIRERIRGKLADISQLHPPMSHSMLASNSVNLLGSQSLTQRSTKSSVKSRRHPTSSSGKHNGEQSTLKLPTIVETPDSQAMHLGSNYFPIETFTPKVPDFDYKNGDEENKEDNNGAEGLDYSDEERDDDELDSSESMIESLDLSEANAAPAARNREPVKKSSTKKAKTYNTKMKPTQNTVSRESMAVTRNRERTVSNEKLPTTRATKKTAKTTNSKTKATSDSKPVRSSRSAKQTQPPMSIEKAKSSLLKSSSDGQLLEPIVQVVPLNLPSKRSMGVKRRSPNVDVATNSGSKRTRKGKVGIAKDSEENKDAEVKAVPRKATRSQTVSKKQEISPLVEVQRNTRRRQPAASNVQQSRSAPSVVKKATESDVPSSYNIAKAKAKQRVTTTAKSKTKNATKTGSDSPVRQPNPMKFETAPKLRAWSDAEVARLKRAIVQVPTNADDYWQAVADTVATRSGDECLELYNRRLDIQKAAQCDLMMKSLVPDEPEPNKKAITAKAGTQKRRKQIREAVTTDAAERWNQDNDGRGDEVMSREGGGLTQSERDALVGLRPDQLPVTPGATASASMVTAGGQALMMSANVKQQNNNRGKRNKEKLHDSDVSSALEVPVNDKKKQDADRLVQRLRAQSKGKSTKKSSGKGGALRAKAMQLDHLSPIGRKFGAAFMPQSMSTPHVTSSMGRRGGVEDEIDEDDTLGNESNAANDTLKDNDGISPIVKRRQ